MPDLALRMMFKMTPLEAASFAPARHLMIAYLHIIVEPLYAPYVLILLLL